MVCRFSSVLISGLGEVREGVHMKPPKSQLEETEFEEDEPHTKRVLGGMLTQMAWKVFNTVMEITVLSKIFKEKCQLTDYLNIDRTGEYFDVMFEARCKPFPVRVDFERKVVEIDGVELKELDQLFIAAEHGSNVHIMLDGKTLAVEPSEGVRIQLSFRFIDIGVFDAYNLALFVK